MMRPTMYSGLSRRKRTASANMSTGPTTRSGDRPRLPERHTSQALGPPSEALTPTIRTQTKVHGRLMPPTVLIVDDGADVSQALAEFLR